MDRPAASADIRAEPGTDGPGEGAEDAEDAAEPVTPAPETATQPPRLDEMFANVELTKWDVLCIGPILLQSLYSLLGQPLTPALIGSHPVLAAFLRGSTASILLCGALAHGGSVPLWQAVAAPFLVLMWVDPFLYWAGRRYGRAILDYYAGQSDKMRRRVGRGEAWFARYGVWAIVFSAFIPFAVVFYIAAGESRMRFPKFLAADVASNLLGISTIVTLGWFLGADRGQTVADTVSHYALYLTGASILLVVVLVVRSARRNMRAMSRGADG